jgi:hypothetical protein
MPAATSPAGPVAGAADDYIYCMRVSVPAQQIIEALTDDRVIGRWWTVVTSSARHGAEVQLFMGGDDPLVFTIEHAPGTRAVTWVVTACGVLPDWVGTRPSFSLESMTDGSCELRFRHIGLRPALECFDQCRAGWDHFMPSLHQFLEAGEGLPNEPRLASARR